MRPANAPERLPAANLTDQDTERHHPVPHAGRLYVACATANFPDRDGAGRVTGDFGHVVLGDAVFQPLGAHVGAEGWGYCWDGVERAEEGG